MIAVAKQEFETEFPNGAGEYGTIGGVDQESAGTEGILHAGLRKTAYLEH